MVSRNPLTCGPLVPTVKNDPASPWDFFLFRKFTEAFNFLVTLERKNQNAGGGTESEHNRAADLIGTVSATLPFQSVDAMHTHLVDYRGEKKLQH